MNSIQETVHRVIVSYLAGRFLTILCKTRFCFRDYYKEVILNFVPFFLAMVISYRLSSYKYWGVSIHEIVALVYSIWQSDVDEMLLTLVFMINCYVAVYGDLSEDTFDNLAFASVTTVFLDLTNPGMLEKYSLDVMRYAFGIVTYVFMTCAGLRFCSFDNIMRSLAILLSVVSSVMAAILLRLDNSKIIEAILPASKIPYTYRRKVVHEFFTLSSFLITFLKVLVTSPSLTLAASVFGPLNIMLFLTSMLSER